MGAKAHLNIYLHIGPTGAVIGHSDKQITHTDLQALIRRDFVNADGLGVRGRRGEERNDEQGVGGAIRQ